MGYAYCPQKNLKTTCERVLQEFSVTVSEDGAKTVEVKKTPVHRAKNNTHFRRWARRHGEKVLFST